jgi:peptidoglycan hydrolase-like protein with peptidoglycan-binding domain
MKFRRQTLSRGSNGPQVKQLQQFLKINADGDFGTGTEMAVKAWQTANNLPPDGIVTPQQFALMRAASPPTPATPFNEKFKGVTLKGSTYPDHTIVANLNITLTQELKNEYLPALHQAMGNQPRGFQLLCTIMAHKEGFKVGSRSYRTNNPGNIGNTDSGRNRSNSTLADGILLQKNYIADIVAGKLDAYPMGKQKIIPPFFSQEIAKNPKSYGMSPYLPGYDFVFTGQLDQFVKIYATGARGGNGYLSMIISYFAQNGLTIGPESKLQDIIKMN